MRVPNGNELTKEQLHSFYHTWMSEQDKWDYVESLWLMEIGETKPEGEEGLRKTWDEHIADLRKDEYTDEEIAKSYPEVCLSEEELAIVVAEQAARQRERIVKLQALLMPKETT